MARLAFVVEVEVEQEPGARTVLATAIVRSHAHGFVLGSSTWAEHGDLADIQSLRFAVPRAVEDALMRAQDRLAREVRHA